jgi:hypothetical protein
MREGIAQHVSGLADRGRAHAVPRHVCVETLDVQGVELRQLEPADPRPQVVPDEPPPLLKRPYRRRSPTRLQPAIEKLADRQATGVRQVADTGFGAEAVEFVDHFLFRATGDGFAFPFA